MQLWPRYSSLPRLWAPHWEDACWDLPQGSTATNTTMMEPPHGTVSNAGLEPNGSVHILPNPTTTLSLPWTHSDEGRKLWKFCLLDNSFS